MSRFPAARRRLEAEVDGVLADRAPAADDVDRLPFTEAVINEAMRLYPPAWSIERDAVDPDDIAGTRRCGNDRRGIPICCTGTRSSGRTPKGSTRTAS